MSLSRDFLNLYKLKKLCVTLERWYLCQSEFHEAISGIILQCAYCAIVYILHALDISYFSLHVICNYCIVGQWLHVSYIICWPEPTCDKIYFHLFYVVF